MHSTRPKQRSAHPQPGLHKRRHANWLRLFLPLALLIFGCFTPTPPPSDPSVSTTGITLLGRTSALAPGSKASFLVQLRQPYGGAVLAGKPVDVSLVSADGTELASASGETSRDGLVAMNFDLADDAPIGNATLKVTGNYPAEGGYSLEEVVYIGRVYNVLVSTDKPVYQPGQTIHLRTLALDSLDLHPAADQPVTLTVEDPEGNRLFRRELTSSAYGIAAADFPLDSQAPSGDYILTAEMGETRSTRSVEVKPYTLPRFAIEFRPDQPWLLPGDTATGVIDAHYFFGKPVAGATVVIEATADVGGEVTVASLSGVTGEDGLFTYEFPLPDYFVGQLDNRSADVDLHISVTDSAGHVEEVDESVTVAEKLILIDAAAESGTLRPGLPNRIYFDLTRPDGSPVTATLTISDSTGLVATATAGDAGLAVITVTATSEEYMPLTVEAVTTDGVATVQSLLVNSDPGDASILLRPDKAVYRIGEQMNLDILVNQGAKTGSGTVYLDITKERQSFALVALPVQNGMAIASVAVDGSLLGTLELNAYMVAGDGTILRDRRLALVNPAPAEVTVTADQTTYRPGDQATLEIAVTKDGAPLPSAVGLSIVDESVFAVEAQAPGFARTYFLLERELQEPRYEIHDFTPLDDADYSPYDELPDSVRTAAIEDDRQLALHGLFAGELAARQRDDAAALAVAAPETGLLALGDWMGNRLFLGLPLLGIMLYDGTRNRRRLFIALIVMSLAAFFWGACAAGGAPAAAPAAEAPALDTASNTTATRGATPPRLRQFFPETLYWLPELMTDDQGKATVDVPLADSITTWRVSVITSDAEGNLGSAQSGIRVFQDFFVEPDLPRFLTVGDELALPVSLYNYLDEPQTVTLEVAPGDWFELEGDGLVTAELAPNEVTARYIPIKVTGFGIQELTVTATGSVASDAIRKEVEVLPDGAHRTELFNGLAEDTGTVIDYTLPENAIAGTGRVTVKLYPSVVSQVLDGLEGLLHEPYGCFEQTTSTTYPNVMVLDYLERSGQLNPAIQLTAERYVVLGYQRLLTFEVDGTPGGFSLFGDPPSGTTLTAYGLQEFTDMSEVSYVDPALLERIITYLTGKQESDGHWEADGYYSVSQDTRRDDVLATAYITWGLAAAGEEDARAVRRGARWLEKEIDSLLAKDEPVDAHVLAMAANALLAAGEDATPLIDRLLSDAQKEGPGLAWRAGDHTFLGGYGVAADIETTALVAQALFKTGEHPQEAMQAIDWLVTQRDGNGAFYTTQGTVQVLRALLLAEEAAGANVPELVEITGNGEQRTVAIGEDNRDTVQSISLPLSEAGPGSLVIRPSDGGSLYYQVIVDYYEPWATAAAADGEGAGETVRIDLGYDRTELEVNDTIVATAEIELLQAGTAGTLLVDLGVPPGFSVITADLEALVDEGVIDRYELTGRQILLYLTNVNSGEPVVISYGLTARFPIRATTPSSQVYDYYAPDTQATAPPVRVIVELGVGD